MLVCMNERGPDSAGFAIFGEADADPAPPGLTSDLERRRPVQPVRGRPGVRLAGAGRPVHPRVGPAGDDRHGRQQRRADRGRVPPRLRAGGLYGAFPGVHLLSAGESIHLFKDVGTPESLVARYDVAGLHGTHAVGHTRMATESAVSPAHAHPFTAGEDFCLVHNGSLSNPYSLRRRLEREGHPVRHRQRHRGRLPVPGVADAGRATRWSRPSTTRSRSWTGSTRC